MEYLDIKLLRLRHRYQPTLDEIVRSRAEREGLRLMIVRGKGAQERKDESPFVSALPTLKMRRLFGLVPSFAADAARCAR